MYKTFMKHAEKVTKSEATDGREVLKGVKHYSSGNMVVTDSHRLYFVKDLHDKGDCLLTSSGKTVEGNYPDVSRLLPDDFKVELTFDVDELIKAVDIILTAAKISDDISAMDFVGDQLQFIAEEVGASYKLSQVSDIDFTSNPQYWLDALRLFKAFKYKEVTLNILSPFRPFTFTTHDDKLMALILPVRRYSN